MDITAFIVSQREKALLIGDYGSYRKQLSRKLLVVRKKLNYASPKNRKYAPKPPVTTEDIANNHECALLPLSEHNVPITKIPSGLCTYFYSPQSERGLRPCI